MTALVKRRHFRAPTPSSSSSPKYPPHPNFVIPEVPSAPQLRHPRSTLHTPTSSFPKCPLHPNFVILRAVAESISACQRTPQKIQRPLHATMDTATSRSMTALCGVTVCARADDGVGKTTASPCSDTLLLVIPEVPAAPQLRHPRSTLRTPTSSSPKCPLHPNFVIPEVPSAPQLRHPRSARCIQTSSFPKCPLHPNFVILRAVAESISACQRTPQKIQRPLHATMDTATSRSMTALCRVTVCARADDRVGKTTASPSPDTPPSFRHLPSFRAHQPYPLTPSDPSAP